LISSLMGPLSFATTTSGVAVIVDVAECGATARPQFPRSPACAFVTSANSPVAKIAEQLLGLLERKRLSPRECFGRMPHRSLTVRMSSQPSLSKSNQAAPKPV
jgi:hypothetical protein